jgi:hypothetical protein
VIPFNDKTWPRFLEYVTKWKDLEGDQSEIARNYIADKTAEFGCYDVELTMCEIPIPVCAGFHQICYSRFTDKQRVDRVNISMQKKVQLAASSSGKFIIIILLIIVINIL